MVTLLADHFKAIADRYPVALRNVYCGASCGPGWLPLVLPVLDACEVAGVEVHQIKEKFGLLRVYTGERPSGSGIGSAIQAAEAKSATVCEDCGAYGKRRSGGWIRTLCDSCDGKRGKR